MSLTKKIWLFLFTFSPLSSFAQPGQGGADNPSGQGGANNPSGQGGANNPTSNSGDSIQLTNPLGDNIQDIPSLVEAILDIVLTIGVPIIVVAIIYAGFQFIAAQGDPKGLEKAKKNLMYVLIGAAILLAAYAIAQVIVSTVTAIRG